MISRSFGALALLVVSACAHAPLPASPAKSAAESVRVAMKLIAVADEKPPKARYLFDLVLDNDGDATWLLFPRALDRSGLPQQGGVTGCEPTVRDGEGRVILGDFLGTGGFLAIRLPAHAHVIVRRVAIAAYALPPQPIVLEVVATPHVTIGGEAIEDWFPSGPTSDANAIVDDAQAKRLAARHSPDHRELAVEAIAPVRLSVTATATR